MDIIRIGNERIKLILTKEDMQKHGITAQTLTQTATRRGALLSLLGEVKQKTGLDAKEGRTVLEAFPDKTGGCEIFVTLLEVERRAKELLYRFPSLELLSAAVERLGNAREGFLGSGLYTLQDGTYYLLLRVREEGSARIPTSYSFLEEYGERERNTLYLSYLREYGTCLCAEGALAYILSEKEPFSV